MKKKVSIGVVVKKKIEKKTIQHISIQTNKNKSASNDLQRSPFDLRLTFQQTQIFFKRSTTKFIGTYFD